MVKCTQRKSQRKVKKGYAARPRKLKIEGIRLRVCERRAECNSKTRAAQRQIDDGQGFHMRSNDEAWAYAQLEWGGMDEMREKAAMRQDLKTKRNFTRQLHE
jgi:hypothetical protein